MGSWRPLMPWVPRILRDACPDHLHAQGSMRQARLAPALSLAAIARHNRAMELSARLDLMNWLVGQGLTGLPETELLRGFCERCCDGGLHLSRAMAFIDTLHPI